MNHLDFTAMIVDHEPNSKYTYIWEYDFESSWIKITLTKKRGVINL